MRINGRPRNHVLCTGPHPADKPGWRRLSDYLCGGCWAELPRETRRRLELSGGSGRVQPVVRLDELRAQLAAGKPLGEMEVSP